MHSTVGIEQKTWFADYRWKMHLTMGIKLEFWSTNYRQEMYYTTLSVELKPSLSIVDIKHTWLHCALSVKSDLLIVGERYTQTC